MSNFFYSWLSQDLGIDLGTSNTRIFVKGKGVVLREPSVVVRHKKTKQILAVGTEAKKMIGKTPVNLEVVKPIQEGVISDFDATQTMLTTFIKKAQEPKKLLSSIFRPRVVVSIPAGVTEVERKAVHDVALASGASKALLVESPMLAAIGANLEVLNSSGILVVLIGGGVTDLAVISLGGVVQGKSLRIAGEEMNETIVNFLRLKYSLLVGELTAEELKMEIGSALLTSKAEDKKAVVRGRGLESGMPVSVKVEASEVREALASVVNQIVVAVTDLIEETPPELLTDIAKIGICLCGGGANLSGLDRLINESAKIPAWVAEKPEEVVVKGCGRLLEDEKLLSKVRIVGKLK